eukprot:scaffold161859_cov26-Prasinocladus_malaysianus.AAC.2
MTSEFREICLPFMIIHVRHMRCLAIANKLDSACYLRTSLVLPRWLLLAGTAAGGGPRRRDPR